MDPLLDTFGDDDADEELACIALLGVIIAGAVQSRTARNDRRREHRRYLIRNDLLPNPRYGTPWQALYHSFSDRAFITTMGFDVTTFHKILNDGFEECWVNWTIPRDDVSRVGQPRTHRRSLDAAGALGLVLHYLSSSMREVNLQLIFALTPSTLSRYLETAQEILYHVVSHMQEARIAMPSTLQEYQTLNEYIIARHPVLTGAFASIDGLSLAVQEAEDRELENATYNAWKSHHCINNVIVFSPEDSGFPKGSADVAGRIIAPLKSGDRVTGTRLDQELALDFNRNLVSFRQTAEWGMRTIQGAFGRLRIPLEINAPSKRLRLLKTCLHLTNIRAVLVGISQIRNVYVPTWRASEDERVWDHFGDMICGEIRRSDRVSRFHVVLEE
ncbi:hypothetical protein BJ165DRAFT_1398167 [Panaeolus papilionaceus]|nr:hypothetical protein BJ165DRAFT_1398167 [Panaeolus papilionaceus]